MAKVWNVQVYFDIKKDCHYTCLTCEGPGINNCKDCYANSNNPLTVDRFLKFG